MGFILKIEGFQNLNSNASEALKFYLGNDEIEKMKLLYEVKKCKNENSSQDSRILVIQGDIDKVQQTDRALMYLLHRWSKQTIDSKYGAQDSFYKSVFISYISKEGIVCSYKFLEVSLYSYEEIISINGKDKKFILQLKQKENSLYNIDVNVQALQHASTSILNTLRNTSQSQVSNQVVSEKSLRFSS